MPFISASAISPYNVNSNLVGEKAFTFGNALLTDGVNDYASRGGQIGNSSNKMTISCWIDSTDSRAFLGSRVSANNSWLMTTNDANSTMNALFRNTDSSLAFCNVPNFNQWNHYFVVYDGTLSAANRIKIWINGASVALSITGTIPTSLASNVGNSFEIGGATSVPIYGVSKYDEVAIWDGVAGTATEAVAAYNSGNGQFANDIGLGTPTSYYRLNGSNGDLTAIDEGSAGEDLTLNNFSGTYFVPFYYTGILDLYPNAAAAYSLRKLRRAYSGSAIRVRIDTTGQPMYDIGFYSNGELDTADLISKAAGNDAYVHTWYDQSGLGNDVIQITTADQPKIATSGIIELENGMPTITFDGASNYLTKGVGNSLDYSGNNIFSFAVCVSNIQNSRIYADDIIGVQGYIINRPYGIGATKTSINDGNGYKTPNTNPATLSTQSLLTTEIIGSSGSFKTRQNSVLQNDITLSPWDGSIGTSGTAGFAVGAGANGGQNFSGNIQSLIIYTSDQSANRTGIETNINKHYNIYWDGSQAGLLDDYPNASAAYSLRALNSDHTGPAISVRRSSDNAVQDIKLLYNGELDTEGLLSFVGAGDGFVSKWYDQSGEGVNATQGSADAQPQIVNSGSVNLENEKPCAVFDGVNDYLESQNVFNEPIASFVSVYKNYQNDNKRPFGVRDSLASSNKNTFAITSTNSLVFDGAFLAGSIAATISQKITYAQKSTTNAKSYINGVENNNSSIALNNTIGFFNIGNPHGALSLEFNGSFQMGIFYPTDQSANREGIETNINDYYNIIP